MPEISRFYGIVIPIRFADHAPPHFHASYQDASASVDIRRLTVLTGDLPPRALGLVIEWAGLHQQELIDDWDRASTGRPVEAIEPLR